MKRMSKKEAHEKYGVSISGPNSMYSYFLREDGCVVDSDGDVRYFPYIELDTFPDDDKDYCKKFRVNRKWLQDILEQLDSFNERKGVDIERFLQGYIWDETDFIYEQAKVSGELLSEWFK